MWCLQLVTIVSALCIPGCIGDSSYFDLSNNGHYQNSHPAYTQNAPSQSYYPDTSYENSKYYHEPSVTYYSTEELYAHLDATISKCAHPRSLMCRPEVGNDIGTCIEFSNRCDGYYDCPYGEDEKGCTDSNAVCGATQIRCCDTNKCANVCDGVVECTNAVDERNCEPVCAWDEVKCSDGVCAKVCDGLPECPGGADENCGPDDGCLFGEYKCNSGTNACVKRCDGQVECDGGEDETLCDTLCTENDIACFNEGANICAEVCDNIVECDDGRDEDPQYCKLCVLCENANCLFEDECDDTTLFPLPE